MQPSVRLFLKETNLKLYVHQACTDVVEAVLALDKTHDAVRTFLGNVKAAFEGI